MGTNYYLHQDCCDKCGRSADKVHIGKSSAGWCFSLRIDPDDGINSLADWEARWSQPNTRVVNEYGDVVPLDALRRTITEREWSGPGGLRRHPIDGFCKAHGDGTYDLVFGDFS